MTKTKSVKINLFNKLLIFNWIQTRNSVLFWILFSINLIAQPLTETLIYSLVDNFNDYSLLVILIPLVTNFIQIMFLVYWLYLENKHNSIDYKLFCSKYSRFNIALSRIVFIFISLVPIIIFQDLFSFFFVAINMTGFFVALLIANSIINLFVYIIFICILVLITDKLGRIAYIFISLLLLILTLGMSLISRPFVINETNAYLNYENSLSQYQSIQTNKLVAENKKEILAIKSNTKLSQQEIINQVNKQSIFTNNFIPSEWLISFYSSLFSNFNIEYDYNHAPYSLLSVNVNTAINMNLNDLANFYVIRPIDLNFAQLSNSEYKALILKNISQIINNYHLLNNESNLNQFNEIFSINDSYNFAIKNWNSLDSTTINFLKDATGINTEYNQLFYLIKYPELLTSKLNNELFVDLKNQYNDQIATLFKNVLTSPISAINLFHANKIDENNLILKTKKSIEKFYPMIQTINNLEPISTIDKNFIADQLLIFNNQNKILVLTNNLIYQELSSTQLNEFKNEFPDVIDENSWKTTANQIALNYNTALSFLNKLKTIVNNVFDYTLMGNSLNLESFNAILNPVNGNQNGYSELFIILYIGIFGLLVWLIIRK
ncbi:MAG: hypothetical protein K2K73_01680, partial [Ureaplasma sp.]|nr:hypothetical protein [Ureaplasma sp.]